MSPTGVVSTSGNFSEASDDCASNGLAATMGAADTEGASAGSGTDAVCSEVMAGVRGSSRDGSLAQGVTTRLKAARIEEQVVGGGGVRVCGVA